MDPDRDFDPGAAEPPHAVDLVADLELDVLWAAMAGGDERLRAVARAGVLAGVADPAVIGHRQRVLADCLRNRDAVRALHDLAGAALAAERKLLRGPFSGRPEPLLGRSVRVLEVFGDFLRRLREFADRPAGDFRSEGFARLFAVVRTELTDDYLASVAELLARLRFEHGFVAGARLGDGGKGVGFVLREPPGPGRPPRAFRRSELRHVVSGPGEQGFRALAELRGRVVNDVANVTAQSADHVRDFFRALHDELGFYLACGQLADRLAELAVPTCWPAPQPPDGQRWSARELSEPCLALRTGGAVVGSDLAADGRRLVLVTGPNQGGKSTFLRAVGVAQLMAQAGMFVAAREFAAPAGPGVFTHHQRAEDAGMVSGRLDEELARFSALADQLRPGALLLCNESFASTDEREGSEIAAEVLRAVTDAGVRVVFVTHLHELARRTHTERPDGCLFLRATRHPDGRRTFRLEPGAPSPTAHGADLYRAVFGQDPVSTADPG